MAKCQITQCPITTYWTGIDKDNDDSLICERYPADWYSYIGALSVNNCTQLSISLRIEKYMIWVGVELKNVWKWL